MWKAGEDSDETIVLPTEGQTNTINAYFSEKLTELYHLHGEALTANVFRACLIWYRMAIMFTAIRAYETMETLPNKLYIGENDFRASFLIVDTLFEHLKGIFQEVMPSGVEKLNGKQQQLYNKLPDRFKRSEFLSIADALKIKKATANKYLVDFQKAGLMIKDENEHGWYIKVE